MEIVYEEATTADVTQMVDLIMDVFVTMEPLNFSLLKQGKSKPRDVRKEAFKTEITNLIPSPFTVVAKHEGKVVGLRLASLQTRSAYLNVPYQHEEVKGLMKLLKEGAGDQLPGVFVNLEVSAVHKGYQKMGISGKMADWVIQRAKTEHGCGGVVSEATGLFSQGLLLKRGFQCVKEVLYEEYKDDLTAMPVFQHTQPHPSIKLLLLEL